MTRRNRLAVLAALALVLAGSSRPAAAPAEAPAAPALTLAELFDRLRVRTPQTAAQTDRELEAKVRRRVAILVVDSSGFTRKTQKYGILQFLSSMVAAYDVLRPLVARHRGHFIKQEADNFYASFEQAADAAQAAVEMQRRLKLHNEGRAVADRFEISVGIHFGEVMLLEDDAFGDAMNVASKIGEDTAGADEILVSDALAHRLPAGRFQAEPLTPVKIGGLEMTLYRIPF